LAVRAKPGLKHARASRLVDIGDDERAIEITVAAAARDGKANQAICAQLAKELGLKKTDLTIKTGATGRLKVIEITGDPALLRERITGWLRTKADHP